MARKRMIAPSFFKHADLYDAEVSSGLPLRVAFAGLWTVADRRGIFAWTRSLKPDVLPYDPCDMLVVLEALAAAQFIVRYEVDGKVFGIIPSLKQHQHFHRDEKENALPAPPQPGADTVQAPGKPRGSTGTNGRLSTIDYRLASKQTLVASDDATPAPPPRAPDYPPEFEAVWTIYPARSGGNSKRDAHSAWRARLRSGVSAELLHAGVERYAAYCRAEGQTGSRFVMMGSSFFGKGEHYLEPWTAGEKPSKDAPLKVANGWFA